MDAERKSAAKAIDIEQELDGDLDLDAVISQLLNVRTKNPGPNNMVELDVDVINKIIARATVLVSE